MADAQQQVERVYDQVVGWLEHFEPLVDPRQAGKVDYPLNEMLLQCLLAVLAGADSWVEIALFGKRKLDFLRRFAAFKNGTPSHDQFGNLFAALDAVAFQGACLCPYLRLSRREPSTTSGFVDDLAHGPRSVGDELLEDAGGDAAHALGVAAIVAERELVEVGLQVLVAHAAGVRADQPAFQQ